MSWDAHKVDVRLAALNAVKMRAALRQSIDAKAIYEGYLATHPEPSKNRAMDRAKARSWAIMHVQFDNEAVRDVLIKIWLENYALGRDSALSAVMRAREVRKAPEMSIDWNKWKPGSKAKELLLRPPSALEDLMRKRGQVIRGLDKTGYERLGSALADSFAAGLSPAASAKLILNVIGDPARALTIAITEGNRASIVASMNTYQEIGIPQIEWFATNDPCDICAESDGEVINIGETFSNGMQSPEDSHPNCRCAVLPVIPDFAEEASMPTDSPNDNGITDLIPFLIGAGLVGSNTTSSSTITPDYLSQYFDD